jgi:hypothetical protein
MFNGGTITRFVIRADSLQVIPPEEHTSDVWLGWQFAVFHHGVARSPSAFSYDQHLGT